MSNVSTYNGFNVTSNYYSSGYADGSLARALQGQSTRPTGSAGSPNYYSQVMSAQQNLFSGWSGFCGCPQSGQTPSPRPSHGSHDGCAGSETSANNGTRTVEVYAHHYRNADGTERIVTTGSSRDPRSCGGPFVCGGQRPGISPGSNPFGYRPESNGSFYQNWSNTPNYGALGLPNPGSFGSQYGSQAYGGSYGSQSYGGQSSYGYQQAYGNQQSYGNPYSYGSQSYGTQAYGNQSSGNQYGSQMPQMPNMPAFNYDFTNFTGTGQFGTVPSAYLGYNGLYSSGTSIGKMNTMSILSSAFSMFM